MISEEDSAHKRFLLSATEEEPNQSDKNIISQYLYNSRNMEDYELVINKWGEDKAITFFKEQMFDYKLVSLFSIWKDLRESEKNKLNEEE